MRSDIPKLFQWDEISIKTRHCKSALNDSVWCMYLIDQWGVLTFGFAHIQLFYFYFVMFCSAQIIYTSVHSLFPNILFLWPSSNLCFYQFHCFLNDYNDQVFPWLIIVLPLIARSFKAGFLISKKNCIPLFNTQRQPHTSLKQENITSNINLRNTLFFNLLIFIDNVGLILKIQR